MTTEILTIGPIELKAFRDKLSMECWGMTLDQAHSAGICINCKKIPPHKTLADKKEYGITALCEPCWSRVVGDDDDLRSQKDETVHTSTD